MTMNELPSFPAEAPSVGGSGSRLKSVARAARALTLGSLRRVFGARLPTLILNGGRRGDGPPDLDELWSDFNRKLGGLFGRGQGSGGAPEPEFQPDMKSAGLGFGLILGVVALIWASTGVFIVQEGEQAVVMSFGKYSKTVEAGFQVRLPYPFQYRLKNITDYLFEYRLPDEAVGQAAESAVREIVGRSQMDSVLYERRDAIQEDLVKSTQAQLDRLKTGILVVSVNVQSVQAPEQVQSAFDDAFKAGADSERLKNEGQSYANDLIPRARGDAARVIEEAKGYKAAVVDRAKGDSQRFASVLEEYQKAPAVTRDRLYIDAMQQIYSNVSKVLVDSRGNSNLLYLPLDKLMQQGAAVPPSASTPPEQATRSSSSSDVRSRDNQRNRERDGR